MIGREAIEPVELGGYRIPAGTTVFMPQWVIHRDGRWFDDPEVVSSRAMGGWLDAADSPLRLLPVRRRSEDLHRQQLRPDGGRADPGDDRAKYRLSLAPDAKIALLPTMTLRPAHGVKVILSRR